MNMALSKDDLKALAQGISSVMTMLDSGTVTAQEMRARARTMPDSEGNCLLGWIDAAEAFRKLPRVDDPPERTVSNPRYRKGTAMQPAKWANCLWRPAP